MILNIFDTSPNYIQSWMWVYYKYCCRPHTEYIMHQSKQKYGNNNYHHWISTNKWYIFCDYNAYKCTNMLTINCNFCGVNLYIFGPKMWNILCRNFECHCFGFHLHWKMWRMRGMTSCLVSKYLVTKRILTFSLALKSLE